MSDLNALADRIQRKAEKYRSNATGMTDAEGEKYDQGWVRGMLDAAEMVRILGGGADGR